ncbi:unnamed protein product [Prunus armeniaca]
MLEVCWWNRPFNPMGVWNTLVINLRIFLSHHGIHHRISCPHHAEQNSLTKRKYRHIVDARLTLLAHASMPPPYWD